MCGSYIAPLYLLQVGRDATTYWGLRDRVARRWVTKVTGRKDYNPIDY
jgi:hypothetical protein